LGESDTICSIIQLIDRSAFDRLVREHEMDKGVRTLTTWELTNALITSWILRLDSFRSVENTLSIPRSTFGDAISNRFHGFFEDLCSQVLIQIMTLTKSNKTYRALWEVLALDSSEIDIHGSIFSLKGWQLKQVGQDDHRGGCKIHVVYNVSQGWIEDFRITGIRKHDSPISLQFKLTSKKVYVFDRAYCDMKFWMNIIIAKSHFVTRLKRCGYTEEIEVFLDLTSVGKFGILYDKNYIVSETQLKKFPFFSTKELRHIVYQDRESKKIFHFITSDLRHSAQFIANLYKKRWGVELIFRWLKSHLRIRYLPVKNSNSAKIQLSTAILVQLLLKLQQLTLSYSGTTSCLLRDIRSSLHRESLGNQASPDGCRWKGATRATTQNHSL
jgi:putative transposase